MVEASGSCILHTTGLRRLGSHLAVCGLVWKCSITTGMLDLTVHVTAVS